MEKILIMGLGRSGLAAAELLKGKAQLYAWDSKPEDKFAPEVIDKLRQEDVVLYIGPDAQEKLAEDHPAEEKFFDKIGKTHAGADFQPYSESPGNWGYSRYEGERCMKLQNKGGVCQTVLLPTKGLYRLRFHARIRPDYPHFGFNSLRAWVHPEGDNSKTNVIGWTTVSSTNFVEHSFAFEAPAAGDYRIALQGMGNPARKDFVNEDCSSIIDGVSLEQVTETFAATPDMPKDLSITVGDGALLSLDFSGTQTVRRLVIGGVRQSGLVTEATDPEHLAGRGALLVEPKGLIFTLQ